MADIDKKRLIFEFCNPNTEKKTFEYITKILLESSFLRIEKEVKRQSEISALHNGRSLGI